MNFSFYSALWYTHWLSQEPCIPCNCHFKNVHIHIFVVLREDELNQKTPECSKLGNCILLIQVLC